MDRLTGIPIGDGLVGYQLHNGIIRVPQAMHGFGGDGLFAGRVKERAEKRMDDVVVLEIGVERVSVERVELLADAKEDVEGRGAQEFGGVHFFIGDDVKGGVGRQGVEVGARVGFQEGETGPVHEAESSGFVEGDALALPLRLFPGEHALVKGFFGPDGFAVVLGGVPPGHAAAEVEMQGQVLQEVGVRDEQELDATGALEEEGVLGGEIGDGFVAELLEKVEEGFAVA